MFITYKNVPIEIKGIKPGFNPETDVGIKIIKHVIDMCYENKTLPSSNGKALP